MRGLLSDMLREENPGTGDGLEAAAMLPPVPVLPAISISAAQDLPVAQDRPVFRVRRTP